MWRHVHSTLLCLFVTLFSMTAFAQESELSPEALNGLTSIKHQIEGIDASESAGVITANQANEARELRLAEAAKFAGRDVSALELEALPSVSASAASKVSATDRVANFAAGLDYFKIIFIVLGIIALLALFGRHAMNLPVEVYEAILLFGGLGAVALANTLSESHTAFVAFGGCLSFAAGLGVAVERHRLRNQMALVSLALMAVAGIAAVAYSSVLVGYVAVLALMAALGFSVIVLPLCYCIGFEDEAALSKATSAGFFLVAVFVVMELTGQSYGNYTAPFRDGALFVGTFVGYLGLLCASTKWHGSRFNYGFMQVITIGAGIAAVVVGTTLDIPELSRIGGTFFVLYLLEKPFEIPVRSFSAYASLTIAVCLSGYFGITAIQENPAQFAPYFLF